jgi:hypothetical protein
MAMVTHPIPGHLRPAFGIGAIPIKGFTLRYPNAWFHGNKLFSDEPEPDFGLVKAAADFEPAAGLFSRQRKPRICIALPADPRPTTGPSYNYPDFPEALEPKRQPVSIGPVLIHRGIGLLDHP